MAPSDATLYDRMVATMLAAWSRYAEVSAGASVERVDHASVALFPTLPERTFYNNAVLDRGLDDARAAAAVAATISLYADAGIDHYAIWAHESEAASIAALTRPGFHVDTTTRAMAMSLDALDETRREIEIAPPDWDEYLRIIEVPAGLLAGLDIDRFPVVIACLDGEHVAAAMAYDHDGDCGIYNVGTRRARPAPRGRHRAHRAHAAPRARARLHDREPAVDADSRAHLRGGRLPRSGPLRRVRSERPARLMSIWLAGWQSPDPAPSCASPCSGPRSATKPSTPSPTCCAPAG